MMILEVDDLSVNFTTSQGILHAVRGVSFGLAQGEVLGIVGESGSGKSVTAHSLLNLLPGNGAISGGDIRYRGSSVPAFTKEQLRSYRGGSVGVIFQEPGRSFDPIYPIEKTMAETIRTHSPELSEDQVREHSLRMLREARVPYAERRLSNYPHQFSGGLLQRIMIAVSLASDPEILIADEPTTALDVTIQAQIIELLLELKRKRNLSIIFITHNLALISGIADRLVVMYAGLVLEQGPTKDILNTPHHPYTRALLDSILTVGDHYRNKKIAAMRGGVPNPLKPEPGCPFAPRCPLVRSDCRSSIPPLAEENGRYHRCVVPGPKDRGISPDQAGRGADSA